METKMPLKEAIMDDGFDAVATFDGDESEYGTTRKGEPYLLVRNVTVDTGQEIVERTVMAFGPAIAPAKALLVPGRPTALRLRDAGSIMKVVSPAEAA
jgi:hypothetical protein